MKQWRYWLAVGGMLLAWSSLSWAGTVVQKKGAATLAVQVDGEPAQLALADTLLVTLTIEGKPRWEITAPRELSAAAPWLLDGAPTTDAKKIGKEQVRWQRRYRVAPRLPGKIAFEFPEVKIRDENGAEQTISWDPVFFTVTTQVTQPDRDALRDITAIEKVPAPAPASPTAWAWWLLAAAVPVLAALVILGVWLRRKAARSARERALYEWRRLQAMNLPERGRSERFITLLTLLVRDFLERAGHLPARRQTTQEFLAALPQFAALTEEDKQFLHAFSQRSEAVKFAQIEMPVEECHAWARKVRDFLRRSPEYLTTDDTDGHG